YEHGLLGHKLILLQNLVDLLTLIPNVDIRPLKELTESGYCDLDRKMVPMNCAKQKSAQFVFAAEFKKLTRVRQRAHRVLHLPKPAMKPFLQLWQGNVRD